MRLLRLAVLFAEPEGPVDGILDHSRCLVEALSARGRISARLFLRPRGSSGISDPTAWLPQPGQSFDLRDAEAVLLQYNPFSYGRRGFAPWLPRAVARLRALPRRPVAALMLHETAVPPLSLRWRAMGGWQRCQLRALRRRCDITFVSTERWMTGTSDVLLGAGSPLPDQRHLREEMRRRLHLEGTVALVSFSTGHPSLLLEAVVAAGRAVAQAVEDVALLNLGAGAPAVPHLPPRVRVISPGWLDREDLARHVAVGDLFLAPFVDGVSARRTTVMAALQHGVPVISTYGEMTDTVLRRAPEALALTPAGDVAAFAAAAGALSVDVARRRALGEGGRALFNLEFAWDRIAAKVEDTLGRQA